jgi:hypothetical protein
MALTEQQIRALQQQLAQAQQQAMMPYSDTSRASTGAHSPRGAEQRSGWTTKVQHDAALANMNRLQGLLSQGGSATGQPVDRVEEARQRIQQLTEGRAGELANDPYQRSVMDFLQGVTGGQNVPFTNEVQGAMLAQQGRGFADAEAAQMEALRQGLEASGGSIYDPSFQSAQREAMSRRQGQNLDAAGRMASQAGLANFDARMAGAGQLSAARNAQNAQINQMNLAGAGYRAQERRVEDAPQQQSAPINYFAQARPQTMQTMQTYRPPVYQYQQPQPTARPTAQTTTTRPAAAPAQQPVYTPAPTRGPMNGPPLPPTQQQLSANPLMQYLVRNNYQQPPIAPGVIRPSGGIPGEPRY